MRRAEYIDLPPQANGGTVPKSMLDQPTLYRPRVSTVYPGRENGKDIAFRCEADLGGTYYCKGDINSRSVRATEWLCTQLANWAGVNTAECAVIDDRERVGTFFASRHVSSMADSFKLDKFLREPHLDEVGRPTGWLSGYLSALYATDMLLGNWDRGRNNLLLQIDGFSARLVAIDFASCNLLSLHSLQFPIASDVTVQLGKRLRQTHGFILTSASQALDKLENLPIAAVGKCIESMPSDWLDVEQRDRFYQLWSNRRIAARIAALRSGLADESLL